MFQLTVEEQNQLATICHRFKTMKHSSDTAGTKGKENRVSCKRKRGKIQDIKA